MVAVFPSHHIRRTTVGAAHLNHLAVAVRFTDVVTLDHDAITYFGLHVTLPSSTYHFDLRGEYLNRVEGPNRTQDRVVVRKRKFRVVRRGPSALAPLTLTGECWQQSPRRCCFETGSILAGSWPKGLRSAISGMRCRGSLDYPRGEVPVALEVAVSHQHGGEVLNQTMLHELRHQRGGLDRRRVRMQFARRRTVEAPGPSDVKDDVGVSIFEAGVRCHRDACILVPSPESIERRICWGT